MDRFASICKSRGLDTPEISTNSDQIKALANLVLNDHRYLIPVFSSFRRFALPIASEWVIGWASTELYETVFVRLSNLCPMLPYLQLLMEHLLTLRSADLPFLSGLHDSEVLKGILRLLLHDHSRFSGYFSAEELRTVAARSEEVELRALALTTLGILLEASELEVGKWIAAYCGDDKITDSLEFSTILQMSRARVEDTALLKQPLDEDLPSTAYESTLVANIDGIFVPRLGGTGGNSDPGEFVATDTSRVNLRRVVQGLLTDKPILLSGDHGSGKTTIVNHLHNKIRGGDLVRIHLGDQTDAKTLIGTFTTGAQPGSFEWTPGALTTAVRNGSWVLIEDIDRAPNDVVAILLSLLTHRELVIPSRNEVIRAAPGFLIVGTTTTKVSLTGDKRQFDTIGARSWEQIAIESPSNADLETLIMHRKPFLTQIAASMLLTTFRRVEEWQDHHKLTRRASTRDLVKLVNRIAQHYSADDIFREAVACFTSFLLDPKPLSEVIADSMGIASSQVEPLLSRHQPSMSLSDRRVVVGRAEVERRHVTSSASRNVDSELQTSKFALTQPTMRLLEEISIAVQHAEPVLLVGETGTGKTAVVQHLAKLARRKLVVINVSQQVETGDLVGGFKPVDARQLSGPLLDEFFELFDATFSRAKNHKFVEVLERTIDKGQWRNVIKLFREAANMAGSRAAPSQKTPESAVTGDKAKRARIEHTGSSTDWGRFVQQVDIFEQRLFSAEKAAQFQFVEGLLIRAVRQGAWVLLDELNLAPSDTIEGIAELLSSRHLTMLELGGEVAHAHPEFRLFANMNPATDVGKRDLPSAVRCQFTELWSPSPDTDAVALRAIIAGYLPAGTQSALVNDVAQLYSESRSLALSHQIVDGTGQRPHFSIRTLSRALSTATLISKTYGLRRALFEAFSMCFMTLLDEASEQKLRDIADQFLLQKLPNRDSVLKQRVPEPQSGTHIQFQHWWMPCGQYPPEESPDYILTRSVERNLLNLVRASSTKLFPILIQGPTSSGKTSMVTYLAKRTGHRIVRINNHEHTDLAEYLGGYESDSDGRLVFREGALVQALRNGHWLILDELNLAPTDVLEALNRLLDDNRELLVPETQEIVKPHPDFILFATQNPPGVYAGRKVLSRAFRNRFLELHFGDIPEDELEVILRDRTGIAPSYAAKIVEVYRELGRQRIQRLFESAATLRDLFRWASRPAIGYEELAFNGYALLGERSRTKQEREAIKAVMERVMRVKIDKEVSELASDQVMKAAPGDIVWTRAMRRVLALVEMALKHKEPVLLVGETGCGKTTIVQALAAAMNSNLIILNAHQNTETGDLVGSQRPVRSPRSTKLFEWVDGPLVTALKEGSMFLLDEISLADDSVLERLNSVLEPERSLFVPEIGSIEAKEGFQFLSTMNPGGDYGKKELSPALRNRFTEIWCPTVDDEDDLRLIIAAKLTHSHHKEREIFNAISVIVKFGLWFAQEFGIVSLRDILSWTEFVNVVGLSHTNLAHGACMVFIDGLGAHAQLMANRDAISKARSRCLNELSRLLSPDAISQIESAEVHRSQEGTFIGGFKLPNISHHPSSPLNSTSFSLAAPTSALNAMRVTRAMQVRKPILLEGSPGAGKTSLVSALAGLCGAKLTRINLSDQTDLSDLFGQDVPLDEPGKFGWRNAPFLRAMKNGEWVLLDEMNLAPQTVLEGLNACLDHRGEAYIPELDRRFDKHPGFTVFAAQNPQGQGGGRKGLPKSFVNRFNVVYVDQLSLRDLHEISATTHPNVPAVVREALVAYVEDLARWTSRAVMSGGPFEFNLRDTMRWLDLIAADQAKNNTALPQKFFSLIVLQRLRTSGDRKTASDLFYRYFERLEVNMISSANVQPTAMRIYNTQVARRGIKWQVHDSLSVLNSQIHALETGVLCVENNWLCILTGNSGSGKTSVVRLLAQLYGQRLREFAMTPEIDSTDLLGEFDQMEYKSELQKLWGFIEDEIKKDCGVEDAVLSDAVRRRHLELVSQLLTNKPTVHDAIAQFEKRDFSRPTFQWVDGMLVRAVENGDWLVLENANLCSAAVLDRLNSLFERNGTLMINECAESDGSPREVKPHPNFRLFMTVNPRYGELSRAMRNRGVEVWMEQSEELSPYEGFSKRKQTVSGALPLQFSKPSTLAKLADLSTTSWLRTIVLVENPATIEYVHTVDSDLYEFAKTLLLEKASSLAYLNEAWAAFRLRKRLDAASHSPNTANLLDISALHSIKDSIDCEFDIFGLITSAFPWMIGGGELASVLTDLTMVSDPSRIPVFRSWLLKYAEEFNLVDLSRLAEQCLGKEYDFSAGGIGMERIWMKFGRSLGFATHRDHNEHLKTLEIGSKFDEMNKNLGVEFADQAAEILTMLASVTHADDQLRAAISQFQMSFDDSRRQIRDESDAKLLRLPFANLWRSFALTFAVHSTAPLGQKLKSVLPRLAFLAGIKTSELQTSLRVGADQLSVPDISVPGSFEATVLDIVHSTNQGQGRSEVREFTQIMANYSDVVAMSLRPCKSVADIVQETANKVLNVVPEARSDPLFVQLLDLNEEDHESVAKAAISLAHELLYLYVCPLPLDPAIAQHVWYDRYVRLQDEFKEDEDCWSEMQQVFGSQSLDVENWLSSRHLHQTPVPSIWRPENSKMALIHQDMLAAFHLTANSAERRMRPDEIEVIVKNADHLSARLVRATGYRDLVSAVRSALALLKMGLSLQIRYGNCTEKSENTQSSSCLQFLDPTRISTKAVVSNEYPLLALRNMCFCAPLPIEELHELLTEIYQRWTLERLRLEEKNREEVAGFKYDDDEDEDVVAEREFRKLFPDYDTMPDLPGEQGDSFARDLAALYCRLLNGSDGSENDPVGSLVDTLVHSVESINHVGGESYENSLSALFLALQTHERDEKLSGVFNFYVDSNLAERTQSVTFSEKVLDRISPMLSLWPEHDTLQIIMRVCQDILLLPPHTPVALLLSKVEQIHHYLYEWDRFASKDVKVTDLMSAASQLVIRWRRLELSTWPAMFTVEKRKAADAAAPFWFHLFETLVAAPSEQLAATAKVLIIFMAESTVGQFERRLALLRAFEQHLRLIKRETVRQCVSNIIQFYNQFASQIRENILNLEISLKKQVDEVVRLASWKDVNIHALKQSAQRSHRQLFKVVKKYRAMLDTKVNTELDLSALDVKRSYTVNRLHGSLTKLNVIGWSEKLSRPLLKTEDWKSLPKYLQDLEGTKKMAERYTTQLSKATPGIVESTDFLVFATDVQKRANELRKETPKVWSKENKKLISALRVEKQGLLTATLRELRTSGLKPAVTKSTVRDQLELSHVLATSPSLDNLQDKAFFEVVEILPRLRSAVNEATMTNSTRDVPPSDLQRGMAFAENAFAHVLRLRRVAAKHLRMPVLSQCQSLLSDMSDLAHTPCEAGRDFYATKKLFGEISNLTRNVMGIVAATLDATPQGLSPSTLGSKQLVESATRYEQASQLKLRTKYAEEWVVKLQESVDALKLELKANISSGLVLPLINEVSSKLAECADAFSSSSGEPIGDATQSVSRASNSVLVVIQQTMKLLNAFNNTNKDPDQDTLKLEEGATDEEEERPDWLTSTLSFVEKLLLTLRSPEVWLSFESAAKDIYGLSTVDPKLAGAQANRLLLFANSYASLSTEVEALFENLLTKTTSGTLVLSVMLYTLATEGFCSPEPTSDDSDEEEAKGDGVGLGDGQGGASTSKDVDEEDDDVSEAMKTSNPDQEERDEADQDDDNAKAMEGDMAGEKEELPTNEDDEDGENNEEEEEEEMDDEIGDVDDLDPNAVDEKMWDDKNDDLNDKEKDTDQGINGEQKEDSEAAKENNDSKQQGDLGEGNEEEKPQDEEGAENGEHDENEESEASDAEGQDENIDQQTQEELQPGVEQSEVLDLPEDMDLDAGENENGDDGDEPEMEDDIDGDEEEGEMPLKAENDIQDPDTAPDSEEDVEEADADAAQPDNNDENEDDPKDAEEEPQDDDRMDVEKGEEAAESEPEDMEKPADEPQGDPEGKGEGAGADIEGLDGLSEATEEKPSEDQATTTENRTQTSGKGDGEDASTEQESMGEGGSSATNVERPETQHDQPPNEKQRAIQESLKQLGDAMKEFHRRQRAIKEQDPEGEANDEQKSSGDHEKPLDGTEDFEHVGAEDAFDTQALGKSSNDQERQTIDNSMAIDDDFNASDAEEQDAAGDEQEGAEHGAGANDEGAFNDEQDEQGGDQATAVAGLTQDADVLDEDASDNDEIRPPSSEAAPSRAAEAEHDLWQLYESKTHDLALILGEQLRLILEPTVASKLRGDYRTGKRLNMKRIIPYIASEFRKDKIWLRRTKPAKREYQIMLALDDSKSMGDPAVVDLAFQAIALVGKALGSIEAGEIGVAKFGSSTEIVHPLDLPFTPQAANGVFRQFGFNQQRTNVHQLLRQTLDMFARESAASEQWKLEIIVSDGITDDHAGLRRLVRRAYDERVMVVFVVLDALNRDTSILDMNEVKYMNDEHGNPKLQVSKYMDDFPFDYYVIVRDITDLPMVLASVLRQYFQAADL